jgi:hypothetical protein
MAGQMCWLPRRGTDGEKILYLRLTSNAAWLPYTAHPHLSVPDYRDIPNGSKGWATCQKLIKAGWNLLPSPKSYETSFVYNSISDRIAS